MRKHDILPNEADVIAENDTLKARVADLETKLSSSQAQQAKPPATPAANQARSLTEQCRDAKAHGSRKQAKYTGITARCIAAKTQTTDETENQTH